MVTIIWGQGDTPILKFNAEQRGSEFEYEHSGDGAGYHGSNGLGPAAKGRGRSGFALFFCSVKRLGKSEQIGNLAKLFCRNSNNLNFQKHQFHEVTPHKHWRRSSPNRRFSSATLVAPTRSLPFLRFEKVRVLASLCLRTTG